VHGSEKVMYMLHLAFFNAGDPGHWMSPCAAPTPVIRVEQRIASLV